MLRRSLAHGPGHIESVESVGSFWNIEMWTFNVSGLSFRSFTYLASASRRHGCWIRAGSHEFRKGAQSLSSLSSCQDLWSGIPSLTSVSPFCWNHPFFLAFMISYVYVSQHPRFIFSVSIYSRFFFTCACGFQISKTEWQRQLCWLKHFSLQNISLSVLFFFSYVVC